MPLSVFFSHNNYLSHFSLDRHAVTSVFFFCNCFFVFWVVFFWGGGGGGLEFFRGWVGGGKMI